MHARIGSERDAGVSAARGARWRASRQGAAMAVLGCLLLSICSATADVFTISDGNSSATVDATGGTGMSDWVVEGADHMQQQWFWYRVGPAGPEANVSTLTLEAGGVSDTNFNGTHETLYLRYKAPGFTIELTFLLTGGTSGSRTSDIAESIKISNLTNDSMEFHFFQYCNLNLRGTALDDWVQIPDGNRAIQTEGSMAVSETVEVPLASHCEAGTFPATWNSLNDDLPTTLSDVVGPVGPGDLTWAFQWDFVLAPKGAYIISKDKHVVPEPGTASLLTLSFFLALRKRMGKS